MHLFGHGVYAVSSQNCVTCLCALFGQYIVCYVVQMISVVCIIGWCCKFLELIWFIFITDGIFTTRLHYSGQMVEFNGKHYVGGKVQHIENCDLDKWSKLEVDDILHKLNFDVSRLEYYYLKPGWA